MSRRRLDRILTAFGVVCVRVVSVAQPAQSASADESHQGGQRV